jgi:poly(hydroxyalkanoate) depolymerase family esterase
MATLHGTLKRLWQRLRGSVARLVRRVSARLFKREVAAGHFETGSASSWRGYVSTAPGVEPARDFLLYVPRGWSRDRRAPLRVLCHGCRQTPEDFSALTRITERADRDGALVLLPRQSQSANAWGCWNWFDANTERGAGEAAIVAAQIVHVRRRYRARRERVWVAGLSAGGALAAVLGIRYPRLVRGILVHSGLACGAASSPGSALSVMRRGPDNDVGRVGDHARGSVRNAAPAEVALLAVHGDRDDVVAPVNALALVDQFLHFNGFRSTASDAAMPRSDATSHPSGAGRYPMRVDDWMRDARVVIRFVRVERLAHAWSGGDGAFAYADPQGPDAFDLLDRFIADVGHRAVAAPEAV